MDLQLKGKTALVTGASMGIGRAIAKELATEGVKVCVAARRKSLLEELAREIVAGGGSHPAIVEVDIMPEGAPTRLTRDAFDALGHIDILVNCAGGSRPPLPLDAPEAEWADMMTLNFVRVRQVTHAVLPGMVRAGWGRIINITGKSEPESLTAASAAKAAVHAWSKALSREIGRHGITINCIPPGRIMSEQIRRKYPEEYRKAHAAKDIPVGRYGEPEELACLAVFLASPIARYITGAVLPVDGGLRRFAF
ncbi:MAG: SDR family oxidoreductase [Betaproteobacteria bacterium]|nr:SDR family oxidoreductase [Betaproteobacteria bacterium]